MLESHERRKDDPITHCASSSLRSGAHERRSRDGHGRRGAGRAPSARPRFPRGAALARPPTGPADQQGVVAAGRLEPPPHRPARPLRHCAPLRVGAVPVLDPPQGGGGGRGLADRPRGYAGPGAPGARRRGRRSRHRAASSSSLGDLPAVLGQVFSEATRAKLAVDTGKYEVKAIKGSGVVRYHVAFPVTGPTRRSAPSSTRRFSRCRRSP